MARSLASGVPSSFWIVSKVVGAMGVLFSSESPYPSCSRLRSPEATSFNFCFSKDSSTHLHS